MEKITNKNGVTYTLLQDVKPDKQNCFWFGGPVAEIDLGDGDSILLCAYGDVRGWLTDLDTGDVVDYFKDKGNNGYRHDIEDYIKNDTQLENALVFDEDKSDYGLELDNNNWLEWVGVSKNSPTTSAESILEENSDNILDELENLTLQDLEAMRGYLFPDNEKRL